MTQYIHCFLSSSTSRTTEMPVIEDTFLHVFVVCSWHSLTAVLIRAGHQKRKLLLLIHRYQSIESGKHSKCHDPTTSKTTTTTPTASMLNLICWRLHDVN